VQDGIAELRAGQRSDCPYFSVTPRPPSLDAPFGEHASRVTTMKLMIDGEWRGNVAPGSDGSTHPIQSGSFRGRITTDGASGFAAEPGRYHLYASYACPFAHRAIVGRVLKGLQNVIDLSVLHPIWDTQDGWVFSGTPYSTTDGGGGHFTHLHQAYSASRADYTGKVTVPVLWDKHTQQIVSNESLDILIMLNEAFDGVGGDRKADLYPRSLRGAIDALNERIVRDLAHRVYAVGASAAQADYDRESAALFAFLDELDRRLADGRRFLHGDALTISDVLAFTPLARFDAVYNPLFRASLKRLVDYRRLAPYVGRIYQLPGVADTVRFDHILMHYNDGDWGVANRRSIIPATPRIDFRSTLTTHSSAA
jgi:putative glutathione S-transferase